jgi:hypothetical protein
MFYAVVLPRPRRRRTVLIGTWLLYETEVIFLGWTHNSIERVYSALPKILIRTKPYRSHVLCFQGETETIQNNKQKMQFHSEIYHLHEAI